MKDHRINNNLVAIALFGEGEANKTNSHDITEIRK